MATQTTGGGSTVSFGNTPQANTDIFSFTEDASNILILNVLANDLGGAAKTLFSLDDGTSASASTKSYAPADLLVKDVAYSSDAAGMAGTGDRSALGARIWIESDGTVHYDKGDINAQLQALATGQTLTDTFTYAIQLGNGTLSWATVTLQFNGANDSVFITSSPQSGSVVEDANATPDLSDSQSAAGTISFNDADLSDTHSASFAAASSNTTSLGTFSLDPVNEAANAANGAVQWHYNLNNAAAQYLAAGQSVTESFVVTVNDGHGSTATQTVTVTITGTNDIVSITSGVQSGAVVEDAPSTPSLSDSLAAAGSISFNDVDLSDGHTATFVAAPGNTTALGTFSLDPVSEAANAANGSVQWHYALNNGAAQYLAEGQSVTERFVVTVNDGHGSTDTQTVTITLTGTNDAPVAVADTNSGNEDTTITGTVASNDSDVDDGATLSYSLNAPVAGLTLNADGSYSFDAGNAAYQHLAEGATTAVVANYTVTDEHGATSTSTLTITLTGTNDAPVAVADTNSGNEDTTITGTVASNDSDVDDGATLSYSLNAPVAGLTLNADGSYSFDAGNAAYQHLAEGATTAVVANYTVTDEHGATSTSTLTITLTGTNDAPVAVADTNSGNEDTTITGTVASNDSDVDDGATLSYSLNAPVAGLTLNADGSYSFDAGNAAYQHLAEGATTAVVANYTVTDEHGATSTSTLTITLTGTNDAPVAVADTNSGNEDTTITGTVASNDSDVDDGATLSYSLNAPVAGLTLNADGSYSFDAGNAAYQHLAEGATTAVVANYTVTDEHGATSTSTLTITLTGTNDAPVAVADTNSGNEDTTITGTVASNDSDVDDGATLSYSLNAPVAGLTLNADGSYSFDAGNAAYQHLAEGATTAVVANYTVTDEHGATSTSTLTITLTGTNDAPVAVADTNSGNEDTTITGTVASNDSDVDDGATLSYSLNAPVAGLTLNADGSYSFDAGNAAYQHLAEGATTAVVANYTVTDEHGATSTSTLTITLTGTNDAPVAVADTNSGNEDTTITGTVASNDSDVDDGATLSYSLNAPVAGLTLNADGSYSFDAGNAAYQHLAEGATTAVVANYTVTDEHGATSTSTLTITLTGTNDAPVAVADTNSGNEDTTITGTVASNDSDVDDGATLSYSLNAPVAGLTLNADGSYSFDAGNAAYQHLAEGATTAVVANYTVTDEHGATSTSTLTITLTGTNDAPVAVADTNSGNEDTTITGTVASNDSDVDDGATLSYSLNAPVAGLTLNADGSYSFDAGNAAYQHLAEGATTAVVANYTVTDEHGATSTSTLTITLTGTNDAPVAVADTNSGNEDTTITGTVASNDSDVDDGATLSYSLNAPVAGLTLNADGSYSFDAGNAAYQHLAEGATTAVVANYTVTDEHGATSTSTLTITLTGTNDAPVAVADTNSGNEDTTITGTVASNDSDVDDGATLSYSLNAPVAGLTLNADGSYSFDAGNAAYQHLAEGATTAVVANYTVTDEHGATSTSTLTITLTGTNDAPVAVADTNSGNEDTTITGTVASNDSDVDDGATLSYSLNAPVAGLTLNADGSYSFDAGNAAYQHLAEGATTAVVANYTVTDEHGATSTSTLTITLTGTNDAPVAVADTNSGNEDTTITGTVASNDSDVDDGATLSYSLNAPVAGLTLNADGSYSFDAGNAAYQHLAEGATTAVVANYTVTDEHGATSTSTLTITLTGTNDAPVAVADTNSGNEDTTITGTVASNDSDVDDGATLSYSLNAPVAGLTLNADGSYSFDAGNAAYQHLAEGATTAVVANYTVTDEHGATSTSTLTITLTGTNDAPVAVADTNSGNEDTTITGTVASNDSDVDDGATLSYSLNAPVAGLTLNADGSYSFDAGNAAYQHLAEGATTAVVANYTVTDEHGATSTSTLTITLTGTNDAPVAVADTNSGNEDTTITGTVASNDSDVDDGATLSYSLNAPVAGLTLNADGSYSFDAGNAAYQHLAEGATTAVVANYTVTDEHGATSTSTLTITLTGTNDAPVAVADTNSGNEDTTITGTVASNDSDVDDGATLSYSLNAPVAGLTLNADGSYSFDAGNAAYQHLAEGATTAVVANYTVTDEHGATSTSTLTITLTGTNDAPVAVADTNSGNEDTTITGTVASNDSDVDDGATLSYSLNAPVAGLTLNADGSYSFDAGNAAYQHLAEGATTAVVANYTVTDEHGATSTSTLTITLTGTNDAPVAVADTNSGNEDTTITGTVASNDSDVDDGATLSYSLNAPVAGLTLNADGSYSFDAGNAAYQHLAEGATTAVVANYTVTDEHGATSTSTLTITLTGTNDAPVAVADTNSGNEDTTITGTVASNDSDVDDGATLSYSLNAPVAGLTLNADGSYSFDAGNAAYQHLAEGATTAVVANYTVTDEHGATSTSTLTITLTGTNDAPVAVADTNSGNEDTTITGTVASNDSDVDDGATLSYSLNAPVAGLTLNADGSYSFDAGNAAYQHLAEGATTAVVANYTVTDEHGATSTSTLTITLTGTNDAPVAVADTNSGNEDTTITGTVASNDSDVDDGATLSYSLNAPVAGLTLNADGSYSFDAGNAAYQHLAEGATTAVVANYTVTDEHGATSTSTLTITLTGTNDAPVAVADTNSGNEDTTITGTVASNDSDVDDGATLSYSLNAPVAGLTLNADGSYSFDAGNAAYQHLAEGATTAVVANYTVTDEHGATSTSTLTITLTGTNDAPVAVADTNSGNEDTTITGTVASNDSDVDDGATLSYSLNAPVAGLTLNADGSYSFDAGNAAYQHLAEGATTAVVANYTVTDEHGATSTSTLTITLTGTNDAPVAVADTNSGNEDTTITGTVASNDSDVDDGATLSYSLNAPVAGLTLNADGSYSFDAGNAAYQHLAEGATTAVVANYTVTDEHGATSTSTLTITLTGTNDAPVAVADTNSGNEDTTITGTVASNDSDVDDGATLSYSLNAPVAGLTLNADGSYSFDAGNAAYQHLAEGATTAVVANYTVTDEHGATSTSTLTITLTGTNDAPVAVADTNSGNEDTTITGTVASNDSDVDDGATLSYSLNAPVAGLTLNADGSYSFDAGNAAYQHLAEGATTAVVANYTVTDEHGATSTSTLTITLTGTNDAPVAVADTNSGNEDTTITGTVASNDSDVDDGATLSYSLNAPVAGLTLNADGSYSFDAGNAAYQHLAEGATTAVVANYTVTDEHGATSTSTLTITLTGTNDAPVAVADTNSGNEDTTITGTVASNDSDVDDGATLSYSLNAPVAGLTLNADGSYSFDAGNAAYQHLAEGATTAVVANYTVTDEHGATSTSTLTITLTGTNDAPVAVADTNSGNEDTTITGTVASNDSDVDDGATLSYSLNAPVAGLTLNADGSYSFDAGNAAYQHLAEGATTAVVANYTVTDEHGATSTSTLTITLTGTNDAPVAVADTNSGNEDTTITGTVASNDSDVDDGATLSYSLNAPVAGLTLNADGSYSFDAGNAAYQHLAEGATTAVVANYTVTDEHGATSTSTLTITLTGTNDAPVAVADTNSGNEDTTITGTVASNDSDVDDGATLSYSLNAPVAGLTLNADGSYSFDAGNAAYQHLAEGATTAVVANYTVTDEHGATSTSTLTITLTGTNDAPVAVADTNSGNEDTTITGTVASNDSDVDDGATLSYSLNAPVAGLTLNADGSYSFDAGNAAYQHLAEGATTAVVANYTVTDEHGATSTSTLTITLTGTNDAPVAVADTNSGNEDTTITGTVASNDSDVDDGATLSYSLNAPVAGLTLNADGSYSFDAGNAAYQHLAEGATTAVVANYTVTDEHGATSTSTLTITLTGTNDAPVAVADTNSGNEDTTITGTVASNDSDVDDGATLSYSLNAPVAGLTLNADGSYSFDAGNAAYQHLAEGATTAVVANYTVTDEHGATSTSTLTITLTGTNDAPVAVADTNSGNEDTTITGTVASNDSDVDDGATLSYSLNAPVAGLTLNADGSYSFDAGNAAYQHLAEGATTAVVANYTVTDEHGATSTSTLTITLTGTNDAPVAVADTNSGNEDTTITGTVASNDSDVDDGATLSYSLNAPVAGLTLNADGSYSFDAGNAAYQHLAEGATTAVVANYTVTDEHGATSTSTLTITLTGTNDAPVAVADTNSGNEDTTITGTVASNDSDVDDGATLSYSLNAPVAGLTLNADGSYSFDAGNAAYQHLAEGATTAVVANYTVTDEHGATSTSTLTITLTGTNDAPVAVADTNSGNEDTTITGTVASNDSDVDDGATLSYSLNAPVAGLTLNADGSYSFDAGNAAYQHLAEGATTAVVANYTVTDEHGATSTSTLTITLTGTNDAPVAVNDTSASVGAIAATEKGGAANGSGGVNGSGNLLTNDTDVDSSLSISAIRNGGTEGAGTAGTLGIGLIGTHGTLTVAANGSYTYVVNESDPLVQALNVGQSTTDIFNYTVTDGSLTDTAVLTVTINGANDAPTIASLSVTGSTISFVATDPDNTTLSLGAPFAAAFGNPTITSGAPLNLAPAQQPTAVSGTLQVTDGSATANVVALFLGTTADDGFTAGGANTAIYGFDGNDILRGGVGADWIFGGNNNDTIIGGSNDNLLDGGSGTDTLQEDADFVSASDSQIVNIENVLLTNPVTIDLSNQTEAFTITGSTGADRIAAGNGNDTIAGAQNDTLLDGGAGTDTLQVNANFTSTSNSQIANIENVNLTTAVTLNLSNQTEGFTITGSSGADSITAGAGNDTILGAQNDTLLNGGAGTDTLQVGANFTSTSNGQIVNIETVTLATAVTLNLSNQTEGFTITGSGSSDTITGGTGADTISAGGGNDTINLADGQFTSGESIDGGSGSDTIVLTNAATIDFTTGSVTGVETLSGSVGLIDQLTMSASQWAGFTTINLGTGSANALNVVASGDISGLGTPVVSNITIGNLTGTGGNDTITLTGAQLDAIIQGAGVGISLGAGSGDTINLTSTSTDLNTLGDGSITGVEAISASTAAAGVQILLGNQSEALTITGSASADTITGGAGADTINGGGGADLIRGGAGNDSLTGGAGADQFRFQSNGNTDTVTDFAVGSDKIGFLEGTGTGAVNYSTSGTPAGATPAAADFTTAATIASINNGNDSKITIITGSQITAQILASTGTNGNHADDTYVVVFNSTTGKAEVWFDDNWFSTAGRVQIATLDGVTSGQVAALTAADFVLYDSSFPAGVAGSPINLGLTDPTADQTDTITVTLAGVASDWIVNGGTDLGDGSWLVQTNVPDGLTITPAAGYTGAMLLLVTESWTNADGSTGSLSFGDNVEAYAPSSPIFALSGNDNLTGSSGHDMFVFSQPIGHDVIYSFDVASDQIDLIGYADFTGFGDIQAHTVNDNAGNAVITLADGQSITLNGVDTASLTASDFVFDQTPVTENAGHMVISNGAILPLSGIIDNTGTIELNSTGSETDLELIEHGITLQGGGHVDLSDSGQNVITGTVSDVTLTNVDNTISGAGHLGDGAMVLVNEGTIIATGTNALNIDTGSNAVTNTGTLEATGTGGLEVHSDIINTGVLWANGGNVKIDGNVSGSGTAQISGSAALEFGAASSANVALDAQATGTIVLHDSFDFSGVVSGFDGNDHLDLLDVAFGADTTASYVANQAGTGGTLSVTDGVHTANITLLGQYDPAGFQSDTDKTTGTLISYHDHLA
ncbi:UNVERIFIED_ORG: VCBS repeat-containing protein [Bradyrhizobium japonicum]|uniref:Ig-like domain-containing protein n=1 Tax=Bradyrhizobium ottawaense TaxID=931866 RepID=UPI002A036738